MPSITLPKVVTSIPPYFFQKNYSWGYFCVFYKANEGKTPISLQIFDFELYFCACPLSIVNVYCTLCTKHDLRLQGEICKKKNNLICEKCHLATTLFFLTKLFYISLLQLSSIDVEKNKIIYPNEK